MQDEIALSEKLDLILGARFDAFDIEVLDNRTGLTLRSRDERVTPRVGLVFKPIEELSFYGTYSETFLPASGEQFTDLVDNGQPANDLDPNTASNLEFGVKWDYNDISLSLGGFRILQDDVSNGAIPGTVERVESEIFGIEAELKGQIRPMAPHPWL